MSLNESRGATKKPLTTPVFYKGHGDLCSYPPFRSSQGAAAPRSSLSGGRAGGESFTYASFVIF